MHAIRQGLQQIYVMIGNHEPSFGIANLAFVLRTQRGIFLELTSDRFSDGICVGYDSARLLGEIRRPRTGSLLTLYPS